METLLYLLYQAAGLAPMIPLDEKLRPTWLFGKTVHEGCDRAGYYEQGDFADEYGSPKCIVKTRLLGTGRAIATSPSAAGWAASAAVPTSAASASAAPCPAFRTSSCPSWTNRRARSSLRAASALYGKIDARAARFTNNTAEQGAEVAAHAARADHRLSPDHVLGRNWNGYDNQARRRTHRQAQESRRNVLGPDHADRRQSGHLSPRSTSTIAGGRVLQHVVDLPRLQHLHARARTRATRTSSPAAFAASAATITPPARYAQNMAFGIGRPRWREWIINLGEAAEYMFDHNLFQDNLVGVDFCEQMVKETNPGVLAKAETTQSPHAERARLSAPSPTSCARSIRSRASSIAKLCR